MFEKSTDMAGSVVRALSDVVVMSFMAQGFHWNVKGPDFHEYHGFFGMIYDDVSGSIDALAEIVRKLGFDAPYLLTDFLENSTIVQSRAGGDPDDMLRQLFDANMAAMQSLMAAAEMSMNLRKHGIADYISGRIDMHDKWKWQIAAALGMQ